MQCRRGIYVSACPAASKIFTDNGNVFFVLMKDLSRRETKQGVIANVSAFSDTAREFGDFDFSSKFYLVNNLNKL